MTHSWTIADLPTQSGKHVVVTGGNSGIGFDAALALARRGADVLIAVRDAERGASAVARIRNEVPGATVESGSLDLANLASVRAFASTLRARGRALDVLINNAGVMAIPRRSTADGFEMQFGTNHLGHFALTGLLLPLLGSGARVVNVSSSAHRLGRMNWDDLQGERRYQKWRAYGQSKLANLLFTFELQRRFEAHGRAAMAVACHPGYAATNLQSVGPMMERSRLGLWMMNVGAALVAQPASMGALPTVYAAAAPGVRGGDFIGPDGLLEIRGGPTVVQPMAAARDGGDAQRLWEVSEKLTGVRYAFEQPASVAAEA